LKSQGEPYVNQITYCNPTRISR